MAFGGVGVAAGAGLELGDLGLDLVAARHDRHAGPGSEREHLAVDERVETPELAHELTQLGLGLALVVRPPLAALRRPRPAQLLGGVLVAGGGDVHMR